MWSQVYPKQVRVVSFGLRADELLSLQDGCDAGDDRRHSSVELCAGTWVCVLFIIIIMFISHLIVSICNLDSTIQRETLLQNLPVFTSYCYSTSLRGTTTAVCWQFSSFFCAKFGDLSSFFHCVQIKRTSLCILNFLIIEFANNIITFILTAIRKQVFLSFFMEKLISNLYDFSEHLCIYHWLNVDFLLFHFWTGRCIANPGQ